MRRSTEAEKSRAHFGLGQPGCNLRSPGSADDCQLSRRQFIVDGTPRSGAARSGLHRPVPNVTTLYCSTRHADPTVRQVPNRRVALVACPPVFTNSLARDSWWAEGETPRASLGAAEPCQLLT